MGVSLLASVYRVAQGMLFKGFGDIGRLGERGEGVQLLPLRSSLPTNLPSKALIEFCF